ncbi:DoxX family protein [Planktotalea arctica]|uniref:DoxX family protein n=1 Tax=Planktotalea arctica TaxID=1481893 RepID=UPI000A171802|nr:DoxX family membrane protein [Planktotalea arctica]
MRSLIALQERLFAPIGAGDAALAFAARFAFAAALALYFFNSGLTKLGGGVMGIFQPSLGAYAQIFPRAMEAAGYDVSQLGLFHWAVVIAGTWAEFILPALIIVGLLTRLAALGMIGFIVVQSLTDLIGHNAWSDPKVLGAWFDRIPDGIILDQRMFWVLALAILVFKGAGWLSLDRVFTKSDA